MKVMAAAVLDVTSAEAATWGDDLDRSSDRLLEIVWWWER